MVEVSEFGVTPSGEKAHAYTLSCGTARVRVSDFGATLLGVEVPDEAGESADVVLGYADVSGYAGVNGACYGGVIGPVANRTDRAEVPLGEKIYHLPGNDGPGLANNLHSDLERGLHKRLWHASVDEDACSVSLSCRLSDGELGLPGNRELTAVYALSSDAQGATVLRLDLGCESDAPTYVNMTNHAYFNLVGHAAGDVLSQVVSIDADSFLPVREDSVSEGEVRPVAGTPFDFGSPKALGADIEEDCEQLRRARGYDHCFCVSGYEPASAPRPALHAEDPTSGRVLDVSVTTPGAHLYTGNWLEDASGVKDGAAYGPRDGFAFEPEFYPDNVHHAEWETPVCEPGRPYSSTIVWRFSVR